MTVLVTYGTKHGSTQEVADAIARTLRTCGEEVTVQPAVQVDDVEPFDTVVVGGSLYMGRWHPDAQRLLQRHHAELAHRNVAVFAMGPRTLAEKELAGSREQLDRALAHVGDVVPVTTAVFGGVFDPEEHRFPLNRVPASDARDWDAIRNWALEIERSTS